MESMEKQIRAYMCCGKEVYMKRISIRIRNAWNELRQILLSSVNSWWSVFKKKNAGILILQCADWLEKVCRKTFSYLRIYMEKWKDFSKGKKASIIAGSAAGLAAVLALVFLYLWNCVPLFYWWPDEIDIPIQAETKAVFTHILYGDRINGKGVARAFDSIPNSNPLTYYYIYNEDTWFTKEEWTPALEQYEKYDELGIIPPLACRVTVLRVRWVDYEKVSSSIPEGEKISIWYPGEMAELRIEEVFFDPREHPLKKGDRILVSLLGRDLKDVMYPNGVGAFDRERRTRDFMRGYQYYVKLDTKERRNDRLAIPNNRYKSNAIYDLPDLYSTNEWDARIRIVPMREYQRDKPKFTGYYEQSGEPIMGASVMLIDILDGYAILADEAKEKDEELREQYAEYQEKWSNYIKQRDQDD